MLYLDEERLNHKNSLEDLRVVEIQTIEFCNRSCYFCPASQRSKLNHGIMDIKVFYKIIDQLLKINFKGRISPDLMSECLWDNRICRMIHDLRSAFPDNVLFINTNGDRLLKKDGFFKKLIKTGIDALQINCYDNQQQYNALLNIIKKKIDNQRIVIYEKISSPEEIFKREDAAKISIRKVFKALGCFWNRAGNIQGIRPKGKFSNQEFCCYPSTQLHINYRGDCILCCSDWKYEVTFGNINEKKIAEIWNSRRYQIYRILHRFKKGKYLPLCDRCNRITDGRNERL